jgi:hypothetical protein
MDDPADEPFVLLTEVPPDSCQCEVLDDVNSYFPPFSSVWSLRLDCLQKSVNRSRDVNLWECLVIRKQFGNRGGEERE